MPAMFQGTVIDAETIYLGTKIEEGFKAIAEAMGDRVLNAHLTALRDTISAADPRSTLRTIRDRNEIDSDLLRKEIALLTKALTPKPEPTIAVGDVQSS